ncbi:MAG TPA: hypothetical protein VK463_05615 [Desulfomonilaceae bacterium]|nr:hypothetical protein [Desulfomonilaceae bacterium]
MKTIRAELKEVSRQKVVTMSDFLLLKRLEILRRYLGLSSNKIVQDSDGAWYSKS